MYAANVVVCVCESVSVSVSLEERKRGYVCVRPIVACPMGHTRDIHGTISNFWCLMGHIWHIYGTYILGPTSVWPLLLQRG